MAEPSLVPGSMAEHSVCMLLKLGQVAFRSTEDRLLGHGVRVRHYSILQALADNGEMSQAELGNYLRIDPATMVASLDDLEQHGLAGRRRDARDRRRYLIELTDKGSALLPDLNTAITAVQDSVLEPLTVEQRAQLHSILRQLNSAPAVTARYDRARGGASPTGDALD